MHSDEENNDSESENDFESLFKESNPEESVFYFRRICVHNADHVYEVTYTFNIDNSVDLSCSLTITEDLSCISPVIFERMLLAIGLCALPWYWMGFGTRRIIIEESVRDKLYRTFFYLHPQTASANAPSS
jgi:hypothetical protein